MTEKEKMLAGQVYDACDEALLCEIGACKDILWRFNNTPPNQTAELQQILQQLLDWRLHHHLAGRYHRQ